MQFLEQIKRWLGEVTEIALLLIALAIVAEILFGSTVPFFGGVVGNLTALLGALGDNGLVGLIALGIILFLYRRRAVAHSHTG
ncbi:MAG: hypothetical protein ACYS8I_02875 [Planctomycetota bacterium]|jgi:hypothetical protein